MPNSQQSPKAKAFHRSYSSVPSIPTNPPKSAHYEADFTFSVPAFKSVYALSHQQPARTIFYFKPSGNTSPVAAALRSSGDITTPISTSSHSSNSVHAKRPWETLQNKNPRQSPSKSKAAASSILRRFALIIPFAII